MIFGWNVIRGIMIDMIVLRERDVDVGDDDDGLQERIEGVRVGCVVVSLDE